MAFLFLDKISFSYNNTEVIKDFSLDVEKGSFTTLLGSSGCGKTTILKLISGFLEPQSGTITINGKKINGVLPNKRKIGMVFQDYALFPHMTVEQNLLYGLKLEKGFSKNKKAALKTVLETAQSLGIEEFFKRFPSELSGGQQQRVALGRVLVLKPDLLLMDEPLSSLDTKLRIKVREELKEIQKKLGITTIYVTHDQTEAMTMASRIVVMNKGYVQQIGTPEEIFNHPSNVFVATFVGSPSMNIINCKLKNNYIYIDESLPKIGMDEEFTLKVNNYYDLDNSIVKVCLNNSDFTYYVKTISKGSKPRGIYKDNKDFVQITELSRNYVSYIN